MDITGISADISFEAVHVEPAGLLPAKEDAPASEARVAIDLWHAVLGVAGARVALSLALDYARDRKVFGRPVAEFENSRYRLAELTAHLAVTETFVDTCVREYAAGQLTAVQGAIARMGAAATHDQAVDRGLQLHGGYGYMREYPIAQAYADARYLRLHADATSDAREVVASGTGL